MKHLLALQKYVLRNTDAGRKMMRHRFLAVETIIVLITMMFAITHNLFNVFLGFIIVSCSAWIFRERSVLLQFKKDFQRERRKDEEGLFDLDRILSIAPEGLTVDIGFRRNEYTWDQIDTVGIDKNHVYILLTGILHYVIPLTAFTGENEAHTFLEAIDAFRTQPNGK
jgi:hypothetical protein